MPVGRVVFTSETATCAGDIVDGKFELKNKGYQSVPLTEYTITVCPPAYVYNPDTGEEEPVKNVDPAMFPQKYQRKGTSDLKFTPVAGHNEHEIVLQK